MTDVYRIYCLSESMSPICQMSGTSGNEALVMREPIATPLGTRWVPCLSGNALRHRCVREPGARHLVDKLGLRGKLTIPQLNYLFHGGNLTEGGGRENTQRIADMQRLFPLTRLVGGTLPDQILSGSMDAWRGTLVCEENRAAIGKTLPAGFELPPQPLRSAESFIEPYQYTRGDAAKTVVDLMAPDSPGEILRGQNQDGKSNLMIFSGQSVIRGSMWLHGFLCKHVSTLELGALFLSLSLWQQAGGTIGGQSARGHGRLHTSLLIEGEPVDQQACIDAYVEHCAAVKDEAVKWLVDVFGARQAKGKKKETAEA